MKTFAVAVSTPSPRAFLLVDRERVGVRRLAEFQTINLVSHLTP